MKTQKPVSDLNPWATVEFRHFVGVRHRNGEWTNVIFKKSMVELDLSATRLRVNLHDDGIEILEEKAP